MATRDIHTLWQFVRGDMPVGDFESWLHAQANLSEVVGADLYNETLFANYRDRQAVFDIKQKLHSALPKLHSCECITLPDTAVVPMGEEDESLLATVNQIRSHGGLLWWPYLSRCDTCDQHWMVAQEEHIYDSYFLRRIDDQTAQAILERNQWPDGFNSYEKLLKVARQLGLPFHFLEPFSYELLETVKDLKIARPSITPEDIAYIFDLELPHAEALLKRTSWFHNLIRRFMPRR